MDLHRVELKLSREELLFEPFTVYYLESMSITEPPSTEAIQNIWACISIEQKQNNREQCVLSLLLNSLICFIKLKWWSWQKTTDVFICCEHWHSLSSEDEL